MRAISKYIKSALVGLLLCATTMFGAEVIVSGAKAPAKPKVTQTVTKNQAKLGLVYITKFKTIPGDAEFGPIDCFSCNVPTTNGWLLYTIHPGGQTFVSGPFYAPSLIGGCRNSTNAPYAAQFAIVQAP